MLNLDEILEALFDYIDVAGLPANVSTEAIAAGALLPTDRQTARALVDINGALQEVWEKGSISLSRRQWAGQLYAPATVTVTVTHNSHAITFDSGWLDWMEGCTIRIPGASLQDNELTRGDDPGALSLVSAFDGASASGVTATVYCDALTLPATLLELIGEVMLAETRPLVWAQSREQFLRADPSWDLSRDYGHGSLAQIASRARTVGQPSTCWVDESYLPGYPTPTRRLRVLPLPSAGGQIRCDGKWGPPVFTSENVSAGAVIEFPEASHESTFLPIALQRWTSSPWFKNEGAKPEIARQHTFAMDKLAGLRTQNRRSINLRPGIRS